MAEEEELFPSLTVGRVQVECSGMRFVLNARAPFDEIAYVYVVV